MQTKNTVIGIRPIIDGRFGGVRENLEDQIDALAQGVKNILESRLHCADGSFVQCVITPAVSGVREAVEADACLREHNAQISISVTSCWAFGAETIDTDPLRLKAVWGFNGSERSGAVYLASVLATYSQKGLPVFGIYGKDVQDKDDNSVPEDVTDKLLQFARAALAVVQMRGRSYLSIGTVSMGIIGSYVDESFFQDFLGMRNEYVDMSEVQRRLELGIFDHEEYTKAREWVSLKCREGSDPNRPEKILTGKEKESVWNTSVQLALIIRDLMCGNENLKKQGWPEEANGHNAIACGFQGQRNWTDNRPNTDFAEAILNSSFDWNGIRAPYIVATENDNLNAVSMLMARLLTNTAVGFADVRTFWSSESIQRVTGYTPQGPAAAGLIHLKNSGAVALDCSGMEGGKGTPELKNFWDITEAEKEACLASTSWHAANRDYFRGGGFSSCVDTKGNMPFTMIRLSLVKGLGPYLQIAEGYSVELPQNVHAVLNDRTDPTWPTLWFAPVLTGEGSFSSVYTVMNDWGANHCAFCYGHIGAELITLASMLRIPVAMHNVDKKRIFRPSVWNAFGGDNDSFGSDFRACHCFGSLY